MSGGGVNWDGTGGRGLTKGMPSLLEVVEKGGAHAGGRPLLLCVLRHGGGCGMQSAGGRESSKEGQTRARARVRPSCSRSGNGSDGRRWQRRTQLRDGSGRGRGRSQSGPVTQRGTSLQALHSRELSFPFPVPHQNRRSVQGSPSFQKLRLDWLAWYLSTRCRASTSESLHHLRA